MRQCVRCVFIIILALLISQYDVLTYTLRSTHLLQWDWLFISTASAQVDDPLITPTAPITTTTTCTNTLDIMLVLDGSSSISGADFQRVRDFSRRLAESFTVAPNATRIGIVQFSDNAQLELPLNADLVQVQSAIQQVQQIDNGTAIGAGIALAHDEIRDNGRANATPLLILLTDGASGDNPVPAALAAQQTGTRIIAIGVGGYDVNELRQIASEPKDQAVFELASFDALTDLDEPIANIACNAAGILLPALPLFPLWILLCIPLLLLPIPLILLLRSATRRSLRDTPLPPSLPFPTPYTGTVAQSKISSDPFPFTPPPSLQYQPALLIGLGKAGRWTLTHAKATLHEAGAPPPIDLMAFDFTGQSEQDMRDTPITVCTATATHGIVDLQLQTESPTELLLLKDAADTATQFVQHIHDQPDMYPILSRWLSDTTTTEQHSRLRLLFLAHLSFVTEHLMQAARRLESRGGKDIFLVASLEEDIGIATVLDFVQLVQLIGKHLQIPIAVHLWVYIPTRRIQYPIPSAPAAWTVLRTLERLQTCFAQDPPTPLLFDLNLTGLPSTLDQSWSERLTTSCKLIDSDRSTNPLTTVPPEDGLYVMVADGICGVLEIPAVRAIQQHRANVNTRVAQYQQQLEVALYSSWGAFTYLLRPAALITEGAAQFIIGWHNALLAESELIQSLEDELIQVREFLKQPTRYRLFDHLTAQEPLNISTPVEAGELLESADDRGRLSQFTAQTMPDYIRRELVVSPKTTAKQAYLQYIQFYVNEPDGSLHTYLDKHSTNIQHQFQHRLTEYILHTLNGNTSGRLTLVRRVLTTLQNRVDLLQQHAVEMSKTARSKTNFASDKEFAEELSTYKLNPLEGLIGKVLSAQQENRLTERYDYLTHHLEISILEQIDSLCFVLKDAIQHANRALNAQKDYIQKEYLSAENSLNDAHRRRLEQVERGAVQHEWGMPHTSVRPLRQFLDLSVSLPNDLQVQRQVQQLRDYVAGRHVQDLWNRSVGGNPPQDSIIWVWDNTQEVPLVLAYRPTRQAPELPVYRVTPEAQLQSFAHEAYSWVWSLELSELLAAEVGDPHRFAVQLDNERASPPIRYNITPQDKHELHTFLIASIKPTDSEQSTSVTNWLRETVAAQQSRTSQYSSHRILDGSNPYRLSYLPSYEILGAIGAGALPALDGLRESYQHYTQPALLPVARQEQLAAWYEQHDKARTFNMHSSLVDLLFDQERLQLFAQALVANLFRVGGDRQISIPVTPPLRVASWLDALRWCMYGATARQIEDLKTQAQSQLASASPDVYASWFAEGLPSLLKQSNQTAERDLSRLLYHILDQYME